MSAEPRTFTVGYQRSSPLKPRQHARQERALPLIRVQASFDSDTRAPEKGECARGACCMFVQYDNTSRPAPRSHPWTAAADADVRYWDFRRQPEMISRVLGDFVPWDHYPAVKKFYDLLRWLNGEGSAFESNGCAFDVPRVDTLTPQVVSDVFDSEPIGVHGRLSIIYRDLSLNAHRSSVEWLKRSLHDHLRDRAPDLPSAVYIGERPHRFTAIDQEGHAVTLRYWAWGADEMVAMQNLESTYDVLHEGLRQISSAAKQHLPAPQP